MPFDLIVSQGRIADRTPGAIEGAALVAHALEVRHGVAGRRIGRAAPAATDDWRGSLARARAVLDGLARAVEAGIEGGSRVVMVANTCSASLASLPKLARARPDAVVLWIDAHGDFNTPETTGSGYLGGMVLAAACGLWDSGHGAGLDPARVVLIGGHDIDPAEDALLRRAGVRRLLPAEASPAAVLAAVGGAPVWVHLDCDALEPGPVPAAYRVPGGLLPQQVRAILAALPPGQVAGLELAEFEASADAAVNARAVAVLLDTVAPLLTAW